MQETVVNRSEAYDCPIKEVIRRALRAGRISALQRAFYLVCSGCDATIAGDKLMVTGSGVTVADWPEDECDWNE